MKKLTTEQYELIKKLCEDLGNNITLVDILNRKDLNPYIDCEVAMEDVKFNIKGVLQYAYESTGDTIEYNGTIKEIIKELVYDDVFKVNDKHTELAKIKDIWSEGEVSELAWFFLGKRDEEHLDVIGAKADREVNHEEIVEYIRELEVWSNFKYSKTVLDF